MDDKIRRINDSGNMANNRPTVFEHCPTAVSSHASFLQGKTKRAQAQCRDVIGKAGAMQPDSSFHPRQAQLQERLSLSQVPHRVAVEELFDGHHLCLISS